MTPDISDIALDKKPSPEEMSRLAEAHFGETVTRITAPGGKSRDSLRVQLANRSVIATYRERDSRRMREIAVLDKLSSAGAPVPAFLGECGPLLFQEDAGSGRLSSEMHRRDREGQAALARGSFNALWEIKRAAKHTGLLAEVPPVAISSQWVAERATLPRKMSDRMEIDPPDVNFGAIAKALVGSPRHFVKWDARPGNATVTQDGKVVWFDWEHAGRRQGVEDFAFLIADEFWPLPPEESLEVLADTCPGDPEPVLEYVTLFATLQCVDRLRLIHHEYGRIGWTQFERAQRYDKVGATQQAVRRLSVHGAAFAERDPKTRPMIDWFGRLGEAITFPPDQTPDE